MINRKLREYILRIITRRNLLFFSFYCIYVRRWMLNKPTVVIISQLCKSNHLVIYLKLTVIYVNYFPIKLEKQILKNFKNLLNCFSRIVMALSISIICAGFIFSIVSTCYCRSFGWQPFWWVCSDISWF